MKNEEHDAEYIKFCPELARSILSCNTLSSKSYTDITSIGMPIYLSHLYNYINSNQEELQEVERTELDRGYTKAALNFLLNVLEAYKQIYISEDSILYKKSKHIILELSSRENQELIKTLLSILLQNNNFQIPTTKFVHDRISLCCEMICRMQRRITELNAIAVKTVSTRSFLQLFQTFLQRTLENEFSFPQVEIVMIIMT